MRGDAERGGVRAAGFFNRGARYGGAPLPLHGSRTIIVHPTNPDVVYVCALGRATGPQQERGVFKTTDGGRTWQRSLFADPNTGCSGLSMDAHDSNTLFAGLWRGLRPLAAR